MQGRRGNGMAGHSDQQALAVLESLRDPMLRWGDVPGAGALAEQLVVSPDSHLIDLFTAVGAEQRRKAMLGGPFHGNPPPIGVLPEFVPGRIPLALLPNGVLSIPLEGLTRNVCVVGPTGVGKTNFLRLLLCSVIHAQQSLVVAFDRKGGELVDCRTFIPAVQNGSLLVVHWKELKLAMLQPPPGADVSMFCNVLVQLLASQLSLFASRRLLSETLRRLYSRRGGGWPQLSEWLLMLDKIKVSPSSRLGGYKEAALYALQGIYNELGSVLDYSSSNMLEQLYSRRGAVVVLTNGLSVEAQSLLAALFINWSYMEREP